MSAPQEIAILYASQERLRSWAAPTRFRTFKQVTLRVCARAQLRVYAVVNQRSLALKGLLGFRNLPARNA